MEAPGTVIEQFFTDTGVTPADPAEATPTTADLEPDDWTAIPPTAEIIDWADPEADEEPVTAAPDTAWQEAAAPRMDAPLKTAKAKVDTTGALCRKGAPPADTLEAPSTAVKPVLPGPGTTPTAPAEGTTTAADLEPPPEDSTEEMAPILVVPDPDPPPASNPTHKSAPVFTH